MQLLLLFNIFALASSVWLSSSQKAADVKIMEEFFEVLNSDQQNVGDNEYKCKNLYTLLHWAFWIETNVANFGISKENSEILKEKCTKNCCQKLQKFLKQMESNKNSVSLKDEQFKQFLENVSQNIEKPVNIPFEDLLQQFKVMKKFEFGIAEEINSLRKLEEAKKKKFEKVKEKEKIKNLYKMEKEKAYELVKPMEDLLRKISSLLYSIKECEEIKGKGTEKFEESKLELNQKIEKLNELIEEERNIRAAKEENQKTLKENIQKLKNTATEIHTEFTLEANDKDIGEWEKKLNSYKEVLGKVKDEIETKSYTRRSHHSHYHHYSSSYSDSDYYGHNHLTYAADNLLYPIGNLIRIKKNIHECPTKLVKEKKEIVQKREELGKEIHSFPMQLKKEAFYTECLPVQPEIENLHKILIEEFSAGMNFENEKLFRKSEDKLEEIFRMLEEVLYKAIASTFDYNPRFFEAAQKYLRKSILKSYLAIKQSKEMPSILENLKEYSLEKHLLWRELYGNFGFCQIGKFEKIEESFQKETKNLNEYEEFHKLITRSLRQQFYKELEVNKQNEIKIRMKYDYLYIDPPRRLLSHHVIDAKTADYSEIAQLMKIPDNQTGMKKYFTVEEADNVFFQLCKNGWNARNYNEERRQESISFAYEFVCALHSHNCPDKEVWPENYVSATEKSRYGSVFGKDYQNWEHEDFREEIHKKKENEECTVEDFQVQFEIDTTEIADKKILEKLLPPTIYYTTGKYWHTAKSDWGREVVRLEEHIDVQELVQMDTENSKENKIVYKTVLKAYACRVDYKLHAFIKNLKIIKKDGTPYGYPLSKVDHLDLYEDNRELLHFKLEDIFLQMHIPKVEEKKEA